MSIYQFNQVAKANQRLEQEVQRLLAAQALAQTNLELALAIDKGILLEDGDQFVALVGPALDKLERHYELFRGPIPGTANLDLAVASVRGVVRPMIRQAETEDWDHLRVTRFHRIDDKITKMSQAVGEIVEATRANQTLALAQVITAQQTVYSYVIGSLILALLLSVYTIYSTLRSITRSVGSLSTAASRLAVGELDQRIVVESEDEIGQLAHTFNAMAEQLQSLYTGLEQRVAERTRNLQAAAEVSHATTSVLDPDQLLRQVVDLARERFDLYYVGLFLLDKERRFAVLRAGTGGAGQHMLARGHQLEVGGQSMIGQCVARGEARIALDVGAEAVRFDNPFLPETRSEMALPLRSRGQVIGAMTVQSTHAAAFDESHIAVMQTMADQVAVAIDNARLFAQTQATLAEMEATQRRYLGQAWDAYTRFNPVSGYAYSKEQGDSDQYRQTDAEMSPLGAEMLAEVQQAMTARRPLLAGDEDGAIPDQHVKESPSPALVAPIMLRGQPIGALGFKQAERGRPWSDEEIALAEVVAEQFALAADNLRLLDETQRRAAREQMINTITDRFARSLDLETILQTAVQELGQSLPVHEVSILVGAPSDAGPDATR
jgi:GAF domain-containing protein/HAMP domain-containing protein